MSDNWRQPLVLSKLLIFLSAVAHVPSCVWLFSCFFITHQDELHLCGVLFITGCLFLGVSLDQNILSRKTLLHVEKTVDNRLYSYISIVLISIG